MLVTDDKPLDDQFQGTQRKVSLPFLHMEIHGSSKLEEQKNHLLLGYLSAFRETIGFLPFPSITDAAVYS
jgi:hypothetical protein